MSHAPLLDLLSEVSDLEHDATLALIDDDYATVKTKLARLALVAVSANSLAQLLREKTRHG